MTPDRITHIRKSLSLTQQAFADIIGVTKQTIWRWESGKSCPHHTFQRKMLELSKQPAENYIENYYV